MQLVCDLGFFAPVLLLTIVVGASAVFISRFMLPYWARYFTKISPCCHALTAFARGLKLGSCPRPSAVKVRWTKASVERIEAPRFVAMAAFV